MSTNTHKLVDCAWLADRLDDPQIRILEVSSDAEGKAYHEGHIPGAVFWFWKDALWHETDREFTTPREMAKRLGAIGVSPETTVWSNISVPSNSYVGGKLSSCDSVKICVDIYFNYLSSSIFVSRKN